MSDERPVKVSFPSQMTVTSPKIDAMARVADRVSTWLHADMREVVRALQTLPELPKLMRESSSRIVEQFQMLLSSRVAIEMKTREANIRVLRRKAEAVEERIDRRIERTEAAREQADRRAAEVNAARSEEHERYIRELDDHAFSLLEQEYPERVEHAFSFVSVPFFEGLAEHLLDSAVSRNALMNDAMDGASAKADAFLAARSEATQLLQPLVAPGLQPGSYSLPFWFVRVRDRSTGEESLGVRFEWDETPVSRHAEDQLLKAAAEAASQLRPCAVSAEAAASIALELRELADPGTTELERLRNDLSSIGGQLATQQRRD